eukprot:scaffold108764_cov72-Phaeocystis_antarctica.AAC.2
MAFWSSQESLIEATTPRRAKVTIQWPSCQAKRVSSRPPHLVRADALTIRNHAASLADALAHGVVA